MSDTTIAWVEELERRHGVPPEFCRALAPLFECLVDRPSCEAQRHELLAAIAALYHGAADPDDGEHGLLQEVRLLVTQFIAELRKMDESLKVLSVILERVRKRVAPPRTQLLH